MRWAPWQSSVVCLVGFARGASASAKCGAGEGEPVGTPRRCAAAGSAAFCFVIPGACSRSPEATSR